MAVATFPLIDKILSGRLEHLLRRYRTEEGRSLRDIADLFATEHGVEVSHALIASWCRDLGIEKKGGPK